MKRISLDIFRIGKTKDERKTRFEQSNEDRVNMNFKRLQQAIEEVNVEKSDSGDVYTKAEADALLSAKANSADVVPKAGGEFTGDVTFNEDVTVNGVLDVTQRRCYAFLSTAGWYRVFVYDSPSNSWAIGGVSFAVDITILDVARQITKITLFGVNGALKFGNETTDTSYDLFIDKVRYNTNGGKGYVDIHYNGRWGGRNTAVHFDVKTAFDTGTSIPSVASMFKAESLQAVADAPSGETVLTTYEFAANTGVLGKYWKDNPLTANSNFVSNHNVRIYVYGRVAVVHGWIVLSAIPSASDILISGIPDAQTEQTVMYWDQNNNTAGALYIGKINGVWCLCTGGYSQTGHTGHYLNLTASYIVTEAYTARI